MNSIESNDGRPAPAEGSLQEDHPDPAFRTALSYIDLSRRYYAAQGYEVPYRWATNFDAPFTPPIAPQTEANVAVVTTSFPIADGKRSPKSVYAAPSIPPPDDMFTADVSWHKEATHTDDVESFLPLRALSEAADEGRIGTVNHRFFGVPTRYSHRLTLADAEQISGWCREDDVDLVLLIPLCPVCHQTVSLVARHLEQNGIPTVVIGSARDVVEQCGVARFLFTDFPLGNPCGRPYDRAMQREILGAALRLAETAFAPRTTVQAPQSWGDHEWRFSYMRVDEDNIEDLRRLGRERRRLQRVNKTVEDF